MISRLIMQAADDDWKVRRKAWEKLKKLGGRAVEPAIDLFERGTFEVRHEAIWLLGERLDALSIRGLLRRVFDPSPKPLDRQFWYRSTTFVMRHALPIGLTVVVLLLALGAPFLSVKWGFPDERVLPTSASAHQVGDQLRSNFTQNSSTAVEVVIPDAGGIAPRAHETGIYGFVGIG